MCESNQSCQSMIRTIQLLACFVCCQCFLESASVAAFSLGQCFKPISNLIKAFVTSSFCHTWIHVSVLMCFAMNSTFQCFLNVLGRHASCGITSTTINQIFHVTVCVSSFTFSST